MFLDSPGFDDQFKNKSGIAPQIAHEYGCIPLETASGQLGGFAGGPAGAAIEAVAGGLLSNIITGSSLLSFYIIPVVNVDLWNIPEKLWGESLIVQAFSRNTNLKIQGNTATSGEPGTEQAFLERVLPILHHVPSGLSIECTCVRPVRALRQNLSLPIETKWQIELIRAISKLNRKEANDIAKKVHSLLPREKYLNPPKGFSFDEGYDLKTLKPKSKIVKVYEAAWKKAVDLGIPLES